MGTKALPPHGTLRRYRLELKTGSPCDKCRATNAKAKAVERANRQAREQRSKLTIVDDPQDIPTDVPTTHQTAPARPPNPALAGTGIENAVRNLLNSSPPGDLLMHVYGEIVITVSRVIATAEPKDIPKLTEEMVDAAKLMRPESGGGTGDDFFAGFGSAS